MPKKMCNHPGCNTLISMKDRYCDAHRKDIAKQKNSEYDKTRRNKDHDKFYHSKRWYAVRDRTMRNAGGLCRSCLEIDMTVRADVIDHIIPIEIDWEKRFDEQNLQPLCHSCHAKKTADDTKKYGRGA